MAAGIDYGISPPVLQLHMVSAFLAMETPDVVISLAREFGGGSLDDRVQSCIWRQCICEADLKFQGPYLKRFLKKLISEIESDGEDVLDELYEHYAFYLTSLQDDDDVAKGNSRILKTISFLFPDESSGLVSCPKSRNFEVHLQCSLNMLEGDTGCSLWPSSIFLSEFILSFPEIFANKCCFEVGSGVGLVGICIAHVKASKVILTDGDLSTLANMKLNLELNHLTTNTCTIDDRGVDHCTGTMNLFRVQVQCVCLPWESASKDNLRSFAPDIILGADIIYDPSYLPHLVRVLASLLRPDSYSSSHKERISNQSLRGELTDNGSPVSEILGHPSANCPVAFVTSVIRNIKTFDYFLALATEADLIVMDITEKIDVFEFLPYLRSYPRVDVRIFKIYCPATGSNSL